MRKTGGFTLIELMIVVTVVAILSMIAIPSYTAYIHKSKRAEVTSVLVQDAQQLEKCFTISQTYAGCVAVPSPYNTLDGDYSIISAAATSTYTLTASPTATGAQKDDAACTQFILQSDGTKTATGSDPSSCW
jgi:type IV pilus assembly protein PilE